jgi:hypothetical protein
MKGPPYYFLKQINPGRRFFPIVNATRERKKALGFGLPVNTSAVNIDISKDNSLSERLGTIATFCKFLLKRGAN